MPLYINCDEESRDKLNRILFLLREFFGEIAMDWRHRYIFC